MKIAFAKYLKKNYTSYTLNKPMHEIIPAQDTAQHLVRTQYSLAIIIIIAVIVVIIYKEGNPLQYSCQDIPMDRGVWSATGHGVAKSRT